MPEHISESTEILPEQIDVAGGIEAVNTFIEAVNKKIEEIKKDKNPIPRLKKLEIIRIGYSEKMAGYFSPVLKSKGNLLNKVKIRLAMEKFSVCATYIEKKKKQIAEKLKPAVIDKGETDTSYIRLKGYERYGNELYHAKQNFPVPEKKLETNPADAPCKIELKPGSSLNEKADESGWTAMPLGKDKFYWRAEYHIKDLAIGNPLKHHIRSRKDNYDEEKLADMEQKAKVHIASFSQKDFALTYFPGKTLLKQKKGGKKKGWFKEGSEINPAIGSKIPAGYSRLDTEKAKKTVMIFNGTYHQQDTGFRINGKWEYAGLAVDGKTVIKPSEHFATAAVYKDGGIKIGTYKNLPDKEKILHLRQNNLMVLENGEIAEGAYKNRPRRFQDNLVGSYLGIDKKGNISYIWFTRTPPEAAATILKKLNFKDVMLLDVHSVISARIANPDQTSLKNGGEKGYDFVPRVKGVIGSSFQWHHAAAYKGSPHDFFAILHK